MSAIAALFGKKKGEKPPTPQEAVQKLRESEDMLAKKQDFLEKKISDQIKIAKTNGTKNKRTALNALKRKKRLEKQLQQIDGTLSTIEFQREALENASTNTEVLKNMGYAAKALKSAHQQLNIDDVDDLMADIQEQQELANEISDALSKPVGFDTGVDEDDLLAELDELEQEELDDKLLQVDETGGKLPEVPAGELPEKRRAAKEADDDDDMAELAAWAN